MVAILFVFLMFFQFMFSWIAFESAMGAMLETYIQFLPKMIVNLLELQTGGPAFASQMLAFGYSHPLILTAVFAMLINLAARYIAGESENHTFDLLLVRPVSRTRIVSNVFLVQLSVTALLSISMFAGTVLGKIIFDINIALSRYALAVLTGFFFFNGIGSMALLISTYSFEKGKAVARSVGLIVFLFFYHTIFKMWTSMNDLLYISYFQIYVPGRIVGGLDDWRVKSLIAALVTIACFLAAVHRFRYRDL